MVKKGAVLHSLENLNQLLLHELQDLYSMENQIIDFLPQVIRATENANLKEAIKTHFHETKGQVVRLNRIFKILNEEPTSVTCEGMKGIIKECDEVIALTGKSPAKDAAIIGGAQKIEHYEIATYGTAIAHAKRLNLNEVADLLKESEDEESNADKMLSKIAEGSFFTTGINSMATENVDTSDIKPKRKL